MTTYLDLLRHVLAHGEPLGSRGTLQSTGTNPGTLSVFAPPPFRHDLGRSGFPAVTTKRLHWHSVRVELSWMLRGDSNVAYLRKHNVRIWDEWAGHDGDLGPVYGAQWRSWPWVDLDNEVGGTIDQVATLLDGIRAAKANPEASCRRRLILSAWNVADLGNMALVPCHYAAQFDVRRNRLSCLMHMRSCDAFLGLPFNIAQYALLTHLLAAQTGLHPGTLTITFGDLHIYRNHLDQVYEQLQRRPCHLPRLALGAYDLSGDLISQFCADPTQAELVGYSSYAPLKAEVAV